MSKWKEYQFNEFILKYLDFRGKTPKKLGMDWGNGNIAALSANNVGNGKIDFSKECYFGSEALYVKWMNKGDCEIEDVVMTMEAPLGNVAQIPDNKKYILSQRTILFKTKPKIVNNNFLFQKLSSSVFQNYLYRNSTGSTVIGIQQKKLDKIKINLPPLPHQRKIARILTTIDNVIEKTESAIAKYKAIKQGMMHDLFTRGIDAETGKLRPTKEEAPHLYKKTELGWTPKEWEVEKLEDVCDVRDGTHESPKYVEYGIPFVTSKNLTEKGIDLTNVSYISYDNHKKFSERSFVQRGDILFGMIGTLGKPIIVDINIEFSIKNVALIKFQNSTKLSNIFCL